MTRSLVLIGAAAVGLIVGPARAHYNMLLPDKHSVKKDEAVTFTYQWGHPFEHQLFDAPAPEGVWVSGPDGKAEEITKTLEKTAVASGDKKVTAYTFRFTPARRGDYVFLLQTPPIWLEDDGEYVRDTVKVVLHVQADKAWGAAPRPVPQLLPLTRPYGLRPGMVFRAQVDQTPEPWAHRIVEVERYNASPPKEMPPDEDVTRTALTDSTGVVACTLTEPGWWSVTAQRDGNGRERDGKKVPLRQRATLWILVDEKR